MEALLSHSMRIALIADAYPPLRSSAAVQLRDLSFELARQGHAVTVMVASPELKEPVFIEDQEGIQVVRLRTQKTKDVNYFRRTIGELMMPFAMLKILRNSRLKDQRWDGIAWYSPTIFLGPLAKALKSQSKCRSYLIVRDIFPEWAVDMGLMRKGLPYLFFKRIANFQYSVADVIGIQTPGNMVYFSEILHQLSPRIEILHNWLAKTPLKPCSISINATPLAGRKVLVYAGNMGIAQKAEVFLELAERLVERRDIGFIFVGRGSESQNLRNFAGARNLNNVAFFDEIDPDEIPSLYSQCHIGLIALDSRHKTHNIPGKFLSYLRSGLPVIAMINPENDLEKIIQENNVGKAVTNSSLDLLTKASTTLLDEIAIDPSFEIRCKQLAEEIFSPETAAKQIVQGLRFV
jgi:glycosyltransferase involved in cell wall biosynthesis